MRHQGILVCHFLFFFKASSIFLQNFSRVAGILILFFFCIIIYTEKDLLDAILNSSASFIFQSIKAFPTVETAILIASFDGKR